MSTEQLSFIMDAIDKINGDWWLILHVAQGAPCSAMEDLYIHARELGCLEEFAEAVNVLRAEISL